MKHLLVLAACLLAPTPALAEVFTCTIHSIEEWRGDIPNGMNDAFAERGTFHFTLDTETGSLAAFDGTSPMGEAEIYTIKEVGDGRNTQIIATETTDTGIVVRIDRRTMTFAQLNPISSLAGDCTVE